MCRPETNIPRRAFFLALILFCSNAAQAEDKPADLHEVREQIQILQASMAETRNRYAQLQDELKHAEARINSLSAHLQTLAQQRQEKQTRLAELQKNRRIQEQSLADHRQRLAGQVRASYMAGRQDYLRMLLNQEAPEHLGRMLTYYDYFNRARARSIADIQEDLQRLDIISAQILYEDNELQHLIQDEQGQKQTLEKQGEERQRILHNLSESLQTQEARLEQLRKDEERLQNFLRNPVLNNATSSGAGLGADKGRLPWPVLGSIRQKFGSARSSGGQWQGILIAAEAGANVQSIAAGRVIFADWLRNFGQLVIIDHGHGDMSLYAYNQNLSTTVGAEVERGTIIARVGNSGGQTESALYFEVRRQGTPKDPLPWLAPASTTRSQE
jgi:murein hydrolase activator